MSDRGRLGLFLVGAAGLLVVLIAGLRGLPAFGHNHERLGLAILASAPTQRQALAVVTAINFDYRGLDTLGEEFILFAAVAAVSLLLRDARSRDPEPGEDDSGEPSSEDQPKCETQPDAGDAIRALGYFLAALIFFYGLYMVLLAHLSLGGGFQGGVILATAWLLLYLAGGDSVFYRLSRKKALGAADALGAGGYAAIGFAALLTGAAFLQNVLPLGKAGNINSAGTIPVINFAVGVEVAAGFVMLFKEFVKELERRRLADQA